MVSVKTIVDSTGKRHLMRNHASGSYYHLDEHAVAVWNLLDGKRNMSEILKVAEKKKIDSQEAYEVLLFFADEGALSSSVEEKREGRVRVVSAFRIEIPVIHHSREFLERIHRALSPLLMRPLPWIALGFIAVTSVLFAESFITIFADPRNFQIAGSTVVGLFFYQFVILTPVIAIHEMSHGLALVHYKGKPGEMGFGLLYFGLMFYTDATDSWSLKRNQRIVVLLAGILSTLFIGAVLWVISFSGLVPAQSFAGRVVLMAAFWCFYSALWNLAPSFETDGYFTLADLVNMPDLKSQTYNYFVHLIKRIFRRPIRDEEKVKGNKRLILASFLIVSIVFMVYIIFATLRIAYYMAIDASSYFARLIFAQNLTPMNIIITSLSVFYFGLSVAGYGVVFGSALKKAAAKTLQFESIHDRVLAIYACVPEALPTSIAGILDKGMRKLGKKYSSRFEVVQAGPMHMAILRMGGAKIAIQQIRANLRKTELAYGHLYQRFLVNNNPAILASVGMNSPKKKRLTRLLRNIGHEISAGGSGEAERIVKQVISERARNTIYQLNSSFSSVWTIEMPPAQQQEFADALLPSSIAEDMSVTDLYGEVELFKKRIIFGFDSLHALALEQKENLKNALANPELHHIVPSFEPVKGRLLFVGRTDPVEVVLADLAPVYVGQIWSGYLDNLLWETNLTLATLAESYSPTREEVENLRDGELNSLRKSIGELAASEEVVLELSRELRRQHRAVTLDSEKILVRIRKSGTPGLHLLQSAFSVNRENLESLSERIRDFEILTKKLYSSWSDIMDTLEHDYPKRERAFKNRRSKILKTYPLFFALSAITAFLAAFNIMPTARFPILGISLTIQVLFGIIYLYTKRSFQGAGRYRSPVFDKIEMPLFAVTQVLFSFVSTADILRPGDIPFSGVRRSGQINSE